VLKAPNKNRDISLARVAKHVFVGVTLTITLVLIQFEFLEHFKYFNIADWFF
jgi:hypothetical protein